MKRGGDDHRKAQAWADVPNVRTDGTAEHPARLAPVLLRHWLAAGYAGQHPPSEGARVTATDPPAGSEPTFGQYVKLTVAGATGAPRREATGPTAGYGDSPTADVRARNNARRPRGLVRRYLLGTSRRR